MRVSSLLALVVVAAVLYLARDVLIPLALAILLAFLLAPAVRRLERWKLGRLASTLIVVLLGFSLIAGVAWVAGAQAVSLAGKLPEYRANIAEKIRYLRAPSDGKLARAAEAIKELEEEAGPGTGRRPLPVVEAPESPYAQLLDALAPVAKPVGTALAVIVFTILMLLHRENMRERLIGLIGPRRINVTTQAMSEAAARVSRYLFMQLVVNAAFGIPFGVALYFIGIPNALLWGLLATLLRFIPYAGVWIAVSLPAMLAFAVFDGWSEVLWVFGVFLALELVLVYAVEPLVYGRSAGLSPIAIIMAAIFWTWLWGPIGLLLATPLTVCVVVMGRYVPELGYLNVLLGVEPVLTPEARFYQRLLAMDLEETEDLAEDYANEHGLLALHEQVVLPALGLAERDRHAQALDERHTRFLFDTTRHVVEYVEDRRAGREAPAAGLPAAKVVARPAPPLAILAAHDEADYVAGLALARLLSPPEFNPQVLAFPLLAGEALDAVAAGGCRVVCLSALPPQAATHAAYLCKRLKKRFPEVKVVVGLWTAEDTTRIAPRLLSVGADAVVTRLADAIETLRQFMVPAGLAMQSHAEPTIALRSGS